VDRLHSNCHALFNFEGAQLCRRVQGRDAGRLRFLIGHVEKCGRGGDGRDDPHCYDREYVSGSGSLEQHAMSFRQYPSSAGRIDLTASRAKAGGKTVEAPPPSASPTEADIGAERLIYAEADDLW